MHSELETIHQLLHTNLMNPISMCHMGSSRVIKQAHHGMRVKKVSRHVMIHWPNMVAIYGAKRSGQDMEGKSCEAYGV